MLHQVEAGFGGVVTQSAVVDARLLAVGTVQLLQVLWNQEEDYILASGLVGFTGYMLKWQQLFPTFAVVFSFYSSRYTAPLKNFLLACFQQNYKTAPHFSSFIL